MSPWPYEFLTLTDAEKALRRTSIDFYASLAFWSSLAPAVVICLVRLVSVVYRRWTARSRGRYSQVPGSPAVKARRETWRGRARDGWRWGMWWMGGDVWVFGMGWGRREEWVGGSVWMGWLLILSVVGTGRGIIHPPFAHLDSVNIIC